MTSPSPQNAFDALLRQNLHAFVRKAFEHLGGQPLRPGRHIELFAAEMQSVFDGETLRLILNAPPRSLKSFVAVVATVAWVLGKRPGFKAMIVTHDDKLSQAHAGLIRKLLEADWYQRVFPATRLDPGHNRAGDFKTTAGGHVFARSLEAGATGHGADWIIIDDPHDAGDVQSQTSRDRAYDLLVQKFLSRLNSQARGAVVLVMQRLHPDDVAGRLIAAGGYKAVTVPLVADQATTYRVGDESWTRPAGDILDPENWGEGRLESFRSSLPAFVWLSQYQQCPVEAQGGLIEERLFTGYDVLPNLPFETFLSFDLAGGGTADNGSYSACAVIQRYGHNLYIPRIWRGRLDFEAMKAKAIGLINLYPQARVLIEDAALGTALISSLAGLGARVIRIPKPTQPKVQRLLAVFDVFAEGRIHLPNHEPWRADFVQEAVQFPGGAYNDQIDAVVQCIAWLKDGKNSPPANFNLGGVLPTRGGGVSRNACGSNPMRVPQRGNPHIMKRPSFGPLKRPPRW